MSKKITRPNDCATGFQGKDVFVSGLTKREHFAALLMSASVAANDHANPDWMTTEKAHDHARSAIMLADALIAELNKVEAKDE